MPAVTRSSRMDQVQSPIIPVVGGWIRETPGTISLGQGVVHYGPPPEVTTAVAAALSQKATHEYNDGSGLPLLVDAIRRKLLAENRIDVSRGSRIMVTAGANMAFMHAVMALTSPGDEVILPTPFYFNHEMAIEMAGCKVVRVPTDEHYQLRLDAIERALTSKTRIIVTISPNNPSGAVLSESSLRAVNDLCRRRGLFHVSDEPYEYFTYGGAQHVSPGAFDDAAGHTVSLFSLSKAYGFAGWRIGYMAYPEAVHGAMMKSQDTILICPTIAAQVGAAAALNVGRAYSEPFVRELASIRDIVCSELAQLRTLATVPAADGAFYVLLRVHTHQNPLTLGERLVREHKVAVIPGTSFGMQDGCYFRVAFGALQKATVAEGIGRLVTGLRTLLA